MFLNIAVMTEGAIFTYLQETLINYITYVHMFGVQAALTALHEYKI